MAALFVGNPPVVQVLATLGVGALFVIAGCLLSDFLLGLLARFSRLGWVCKVAVLFFVVQLTMFGGAKHGGTNDVNDAENGEAYPPSEASSEGGAMRGVSSPLQNEVVAVQPEAVRTPLLHSPPPPRTSSPRTCGPGRACRTSRSARGRTSRSCGNSHTGSRHLQARRLPPWSSSDASSLCLPFEILDE